MNNLIISASGYAGSDQAAQTILSGVNNGYTLFKGSIDTLWHKTLDGGVYTSLVKTAIGFAVIGLLFFTLKLLRQWLKDELSYESIQTWMVTLLVCMLLANDGSLLKDVVFGFRGIADNINRDFLQNVHTDVTLSAALQKVTGSQVLTDQISTEIKKCDSVVDSKEREQCLKDAAETIEKLADKVPLTDKVKGQVEAFFKNPVGTAFNLAIAPAAFNFELIIVAGLVSLGLGFQVIAEICLLLTGLIAPIPVALTLLPGKMQTIFTWIVSFFSISFFRLFYNAMVGFTAVLMLDANWIGNLCFAAIVGLIAPILAAGLSIGGGIGVLNSLVGVANFSMNAIITAGLRKK